MRRAFKFHLQRRILVKQIVVTGLTALSALIVLVPIFIMVNAALRPITEILAYPPKWMPDRVTLQYFEAVVLNPENQRHFVNSSLLALSTLILSINLGYLAAYAFS